MNSSRPMSRRRFLAIVGGTGIVTAAGLGGWRLVAGGSNATIGNPGPQTSQRSIGSIDPSVEIIEVQPGFVDATVWNDQLLTLRADHTGTGITLRSETSGIHYPVNAPDHFTARCVGVIDDTIIVGGHREIEAGRMSFEEGTSYETLLGLAGPEAAALLSQPVQPVAHAHEHTITSKITSLVASEDIGKWNTRDVVLPDNTGGSIAAVLERSGALALDHYRFPSSADSNYEAVLIDAKEALKGLGQLRSWSKTVDHGSIISSASGLSNDVVVVSDRYGVRCFDHDGTNVFDFDDGSLYAVQPLSGDLSDITAVGVITFEGEVETRFYRYGTEFAPPVSVMLLTHQVSPHVTLAAPAGRVGSVFASASRIP